MRGWLASAVMIGAALSLPAVAHAQLSVSTPDGTWDDAVRALAARLDSEGAFVRVCAHEDDGVCARCGAYTVDVDPSVFELGVCDDATGETVVRLVDRAALFDHAAAIPRLRVPVLVATLAPAVPPRSEPVPVIDEHLCRADVRAFARDLEHGTFVALTPEHFSLRTEASDVERIEAGDRFVLTRPEAGVVGYVVVDRATGEVMVDGVAELVCPSEPAPIEPAVEPPRVSTGSGVRVREPPPERIVAQVLSNTGFALTGLGALGLFVTAGFLIWDISVFACVIDAAFDPMAARCPGALPLPIELPIASGVALGVGLAIALPARLVESSASSAPGEARASVSFGGRF